MKGRIKFGEHGQPDRYFIDRNEVTKAEFDAAFPPKPLGDGSGLIGWHQPIESDALAVHPNQIVEVMERNKKHGLEIEYRADDGRPILTSREQRRKLMRIEGVHDLQGGYSD